MKLLILVAASCVLRAGTEPKPTPAGYPARVTLPAAALAAEYGGRGISQPNDSHHVGDYLVVEVALFAGPAAPVPIAARDFRLRLNRATRELSAQSPGLVAGALRNPGWERYRGVQASAGAGPAVIVMGGPEQAERFPGDPQARRPTQPRAPETDPGKPSSALTAAEAVEKYALEEGPVKGARSGLLYFHWDGKLKGIKSIELIYDGPAGQAVLKLR